MKLEDNFKMEDVVLLYDEHIPCSMWKMGHIVKVYLDSCNSSSSAGSLWRTGTKVCWVLPEV